MAWSLVDFWFPGETERVANLDARNAELEKKRLAMGRDTPEAAAAQMEAFSAGEDYNAQILGAAGQGAIDGLAALPGKARAAISGATGWSLSFVPWWGWLVLALALFVWLGGAEWSRGILARRK